MRATVAEGDNRNRDDGKDACTATARTSANQRRATTQPGASTATTSAHRQRATTQPGMRRRCVERRRRCVARQRRLGKQEGMHTRGKREGRRQQTRGSSAPRREASRQPAGGASSASSSSSAYVPPRRDGGAPRKIPSNGGVSVISRVVHEFGISEIRESPFVVVDPLALPPSSPPSDARRALLAAAAPAAKQLRLQR